MLRVRMVIALLISATLTFALVGGVLYLAISVHWLIAVLLVGFLMEGADAIGKRPKRIDPPRALRERVEAMLQRLCIVADTPVPGLQFLKDDRPLCWATSLPSRKPRIQISMKMVEISPDSELEAVLAHELGHIVNGDAWVMTLMSAPLWLLAGVRHYWEQRKQENWIGYVLGTIVMGIPALVISLPGALAAWHLSRHRELAADRAAALFTGSPSAVAAALLRVSGAIQKIPTKDLRSATALTVFNWLPLGPERDGLARLWATHPPLQRRLEQLERMEGSQT